VSPVNERQWQGRVLIWLNEFLRLNGLPFDRVEQEVEVTIGSQVHRFTDLTLYDKHGKRACVFELKLPDRPDGRSPRYLPVVTETQRKADAMGAEYFVTWNVNSAVLWKTHIPGRAPQERSLIQYPSIVSIQESDALNYPAVEQALKVFVKDFIHEFGNIYLGVKLAPPQPLDEGFVQTVLSYLDPLLVGVTSYELRQLYQSNPTFKEGLRKWAVEEQGWTWEDSPSHLQESLSRTSRLACSMLVNKLVFYEAMRKVYPGLLSLTIPITIQTGEQLHQRLKGIFDRAQKIDYENVFTEELIDVVPFLSNRAVELWRCMVEDIERYDFTRFGYEVIGRIFERLIVPDERHKLGQYFTPSLVVDLINAFCIKSPGAAVLDPGCGAGTFLVRAYHRLKQLDPRKSHEELLSALWGIDIARYPAHLSVINLVARDLASTENYPRIIHDDFFKVFPETSQYPFYRRAYAIEGPSTEKVQTTVPLFDAVVGNPPYTRQEEMEDLFQGLKDRAHRAVYRDWRVEVSKRSSIYALFFLHGATFLKPRGHLGLLTHSSWLDVDYGKHLQEFFLKNFELIAILEPQVEHWFPVVDVNTVITILRRCANARKRNSNLVRFVQIKVPLANLVPDISDEGLRKAALERLVDRIEAVKEIEDNEFWRIYPIKQANLWKEGLDEEGKYTGAKWGKYLRAPEVFFSIIERGKSKFCCLGDVVELKRGFTSGSNEFFYVKDITDDLKPAELRHYALTKAKAKRVRVILTEDGDTYLIEAKFLKPIIKSTRDATSIKVMPSWVKYKALIVSEDKRKLRGKHVLKYILDGESKIFGSGPRADIPAKKPTCAARNPWYALDHTNYGKFLWFMNITDTHAVPYNPGNVLSDNRFYNMNPRVPSQEKTLWGLFNATFTFLCAELWGRQFAGRGIDSIDIKVYEVAQLPMLKPRAIPIKCKEAIINAVESIAQRTILPILDEVNQADRRALDDAFLEAAGFNQPEERKQVLESLYFAVCHRVQTRFDRARSVKHEVSQRGRTDPQRIAAELLREIDPALLKRFPKDFLPASFAYREIEIPHEPIGFERLTFNRLRIGDQTIDFEMPEEAEFLQFCLENGVEGNIQVPTEQDILRRIVADYRSYLHQVEQAIDRLASSRTADRRLRARIKDALRQQLGQSRVSREQQTKLI